MNPWTPFLTSIIGGRKWIIATGVVQAGHAIANVLKTYGVDDVLVVAGCEGTGPLDKTIQTIDLGVRGTDMMSSIRAAEAALDHLPLDVQRQIDEWDPNQEAGVFRPFFSVGNPVAGRPTFGRRTDAAQALEDKTVVDTLWQELGLPHAPFRVLSADGDYDRVFEELNQGDGVVFSGDSKAGFNGGASYVRWVKTPEERAAAKAFFKTDCDRVRAMPFLDGLPCSIHAFVAEDTTYAFRPCEMLVFRNSAKRTFTYASVATTWRPHPTVTESMRTLATTVGDALRDRIHYRGVFTVDGVLTSTGFLPTELNPRVGAGIAPLLHGLDCPMEFLHYAAIEGFDVPGLDELEQAVRAADTGKARAGIPTPSTLSDSSHVFRRANGTFEEVTEGSDGWTVVRGKSADQGGFLRIVGESPSLVGPPAAPEVTALAAYLNTLWNLGLAPLEAASDVFVP